MCGRSSKCRYCKDPLGVTGGTQSCCAQPDCVIKAGSACDTTLLCGHKCAGVKGEAFCLPCFEPECWSQATVSCGAGGTLGQPVSRQQPDDYCPICYVECLSDAPTLKLSSCGHLMHAHCARVRYCYRLLKQYRIVSHDILYLLL